MPDKNKVIEGLEKAKRFFEACADMAVGDGKMLLLSWAKALGDAIELLKAQEPIKPKVNIDTWVCGSCGTRIERQSLIGPNAVLAETFNFCPNCGKAVKWDD